MLYAQTQFEKLMHWLASPTGRLLVLFAVFTVAAFAQAAPWSVPAGTVNSWFDTEFTKIAAIFLVAMALEWKFSAHSGVLAGTALVLLVLGVIRYRVALAGMF